MFFELIPIAEASVGTLMQSINRVIINPVILLMFSIAVVYFLYGVMQYLISPDDEELRTTSKSHMLYGIIGIFIMMSVFGIMRVIMNSLGENHIKITDTGEVNIAPRNDPGFNNLGDSLLDRQQYTPVDNGIKKPADTSYVDTNITTKENQNDTSSVNSSNTFKKTTPGTAGNTSGSAEGTTGGLPAIKNESNLPSLDPDISKIVEDMKASYKSDDKNYKVVASGTAASSQGSKEQAVLNARIMVAKEKGLNSIDTAYNGGILYEKIWKVGEVYHYWLAMSSPK
ncbi:MAG: hypothetical protein RL687_207 [Candidatus Parcubacteria bacterium]|jgi:hypothetical protein